MLQRLQAGSGTLELFGLPAVQAVIRHKWLTFAKQLLLVNIACFMLWLMAFTVFMCIYTVRGRVAVHSISNTPHPTPHTAWMPDR